MKKLSVGIIGLGCRGMSVLTSELLEMRNIEITAVSDSYQDRIEKACSVVKDKYDKKPFATTDYHELLDKSPDAVIIATPWKNHIKITIEAMRKKIAVGCEVGGANDIQECVDLVKTYEETGTPCMLLENCCYGRNELMILNMIKQGVFGEIIHCQGGYRHDLRGEIDNGIENRHYRFEEYLHKNRENYPTHELGPIAFCLDINRGNKLKNLISVSSKASGLAEYRKINGKPPLTYTQGDVVTTIITCENGQTIVLTLDTTLPRYYSRGFHIQGTKAMFDEDNLSIYINDEHTPYEFDWKPMWNNVENYREKYEHPIWQKYKDNVSGGHWGMDRLVFDAFFNSIANNKPMPIDVYDMATWMSISALSEKSLKQNSFVEIPDFTRGKWKDKRELLL